MPIIGHVSTNHCNSMIAHSFSYLETKIQVCNISRTPVRPQNVRGVDHQLLDANMNYLLQWIPIIGQDLNWCGLCYRLDHDLWTGLEFYRPMDFSVVVK